MRCHVRQGERLRAVALYEGYRRVLKAHPGQLPAARVEALYRELQQNSH